MGNTPKSRTDQRRKLTDLRREQQRAERRRTLIFVGIAVVLAAGLVTGAVLSTTGAEKSADEIKTLGVAATDAGCSEPTEATKEIQASHVGPGGDARTAGIGRVDYATVPPSGGDHFVQAAPPNRQFYERDGEAIPERLVHNLEHGYVVAWYDKRLPDDEVEVLESLAGSIGPAGPQYGPKFIAAPYDRAEFDGDMRVGMSAWGVTQLCERVSGEAISEFVAAYRAPDGSKFKAPEPNVP